MSEDRTEYLITESLKSGRDKIVKGHLHLPDNLSGKTVLELFSGVEEQTLKEPIEKRGEVLLVRQIYI